MKCQVEKIIYFRPYSNINDYYAELYAIAKESKTNRDVYLLICPRRKPDSKERMDYVDVTCFPDDSSTWEGMLKRYNHKTKQEYLDYFAKKDEDARNWSYPFEGLCLF